jgi:hypothetical protein
MTFSRNDFEKFRNVMESSLPGVIPHGFEVVSELPKFAPSGLSVMRGTLDDGREIAWVKQPNAFYITSA